MQVSLKELASRWPSTIVARQQLGVFSGGVLNPETIKNLDSQGKGIPGMFKVGRKCVYPVSSVITYLEEQAQQS